MVWGAKWKEREGGVEGRYRNGDVLNRWEDTLANTILGTQPNYPLAYAPVLEFHHPIMSTIGYPGGRLER